jgi:hypothetical protein
LNEYAEAVCTALHCIRELEAAPGAGDALDLWHPLAHRLCHDATVTLGLLGGLYTQASGGWTAEHQLWFPVGGPCFDRDTFQGLVTLWRATAAVVRMCRTHGLPLTLDTAYAPLLAASAVLLADKAPGMQEAPLVRGFAVVALHRLLPLPAVRALGAPALPRALTRLSALVLVYRTLAGPCKVFPPRLDGCPG